MRAVRLGFFLLLATAMPVGAQANTAEALDRAVRSFEELQVERALTLLRQIISSGSPFEVTRDQRVRAYKYLGASLALVGMRDSALVYFRAALERDPFTDLEQERHTEQERSAFLEARYQLFALSARPVQRAVIDPATEYVTFTFVTTHPAMLTVELREGTSGTRIPLYAGDGEGVRELAWNGLTTDGRLAPAGRYELVFAGTSMHSGRSDSTRLYLTVGHDRPALEDTMPTIPPGSLLPEAHPQSAAPLELAKGMGLAASALLLPTLLANDQLDRGDRKLVAVVVTGAAVTGIVSSVIRQRRREIPANIVTNRQRIAERDSRNAEIRQRNAQRLAQTRLVIEPAGGITP